MLPPDGKFVLTYYEHKGHVEKPFDREVKPQSCLQKLSQLVVAAFESLALHSDIKALSFIDLVKR